jgi:hypothetical protein
MAGESHDLGGVAQCFSGARVAAAVNRISQLLELPGEPSAIAITTGIRPTAIVATAECNSGRQEE